MPFASPSLQRLVPALLAALFLGSVCASAQEFTYDPKVSEQYAKKLGIPVYFSVPQSAWATLPKLKKTGDKLIELRHPDANGTNAGLRLYVAKRKNLSSKLATSGLVQTGDLLLTFRAEWGGAGPYPNIQMGISHTGIAYVEKGTVKHLDNPMDKIHVGSGNFTSEHYRTLNLLHVVRPRGLTDAQRANLLAWSKLLSGSASKIYGEGNPLGFNQDYNDPKFKSGGSLDFVKQFGQIALGQKPAGQLKMYCSEYAWSLLALRDCDPKATADAFKASGTPSCIKSPMQPMEPVGTYVGSRSKYGQAGLADGPLLVVDSLKLATEPRRTALQSVFVEDEAKMAKMSSGHQQVSKSVQSHFAFLRSYYVAALSDNALMRSSARVRGAFIRTIMPVNYSPTSYLVNTFLPSDNATRTMDSVATIVLE